MPSAWTLNLVPIAWNESATLHAKIFYVASDLLAPRSPRFELLHRELFKAVAAQGRANNLDAQVDHYAGIFARYGMGRAEFLAQLSSFTVRSRVKSAEGVVHTLKVIESPVMMINDEGLVLNRDVRSVKGATAIADFLIRKSVEQSEQALSESATAAKGYLFVG